MRRADFPDEFLWGVSTSAFQIEGAVDEDGRGRSVWDTFCAQPGRIADGATAEIAADHYHRWSEDLELMSLLGVGAYRFSVSWPRVQPSGSGAANGKGLDFYDRLVDALCEAGIDPVCTLYHWDTPQSLEDADGWCARETAYRFADYAEIVGQRLADRVRMWIPLNEPMVETVYGYAIGEYAPGRTLLFDALPTAHHQHLAHGLAVRALRSAGAERIGTANNHSPIWPQRDTPEDHAAATVLDALINRLFSDPVLLRSYPEPMLPYLPEGCADDLPVIAEPLDFYGVNYYEPQPVTAPAAGSELPFELASLEGYPHTNNGSPIVPDGLRELLVGLAGRAGAALPPVFVTENGCSGTDPLGEDGQVRDRHRITFLDEHLRALREAMDAGVDVRGYFVWSLLDNFEWSKGYRPRFGLVHTDYSTMARTPKDSFHWFRRFLGGTG